MFLESRTNPTGDDDRPVIRSVLANGSGDATPGARGTLLPLSDWDNGTFVGEAVVKPGPAATLAPIGVTQAMVVVVCLDSCQALHLCTNDEPPRSHPVAEGSIILLDAQDEHRLAAAGEVRIVCFGVEISVLDQLVRRNAISAVGASAATHGPDQAPADATIYGLATSARSVLRDPSPSSRLFLEQVTCAVAAHLLLRLEAARARLAGSGGLAPWQLAKVKRLVSANLGRTLQAHELARTCGLSPSHFSRAFRCSTGTSPHAWVTIQRVARAKGLMRTSAAQLAEIALECGFADQSHFTRVFTREEGRQSRVMAPEPQPGRTRIDTDRGAAAGPPPSAIPNLSSGLDDGADVTGSRPSRPLPPRRLVQQTSVARPSAGATS